MGTPQRVAGQCAWYSRGHTRRRRWGGNSPGFNQLGPEDSGWPWDVSWERGEGDSGKVTGTKDGRSLVGCRVMGLRCWTERGALRIRQTGRPQTCRFQGQGLWFHVLSQHQEQGFPWDLRGVGPLAPPQTHCSSIPEHGPCFNRLPGLSDMH